MGNLTVCLRIAGTIFGGVALLHLARIVSGIPILIGTVQLPFWVNWMGMAATAFLGVWLWSLSMRKCSDPESAQDGIVKPEKVH